MAKRRHASASLGQRPLQWPTGHSQECGGRCAGARRHSPSHIASCIAGLRRSWLAVRAASIQLRWTMVRRARTWITSRQPRQTRSGDLPDPRQNQKSLPAGSIRGQPLHPPRYANRTHFDVTDVPGAAAAISRALTTLRSPGQFRPRSRSAAGQSVRPPRRRDCSGDHDSLPCPYASTAGPSRTMRPQ